MDTLSYTSLFTGPTMRFDQLTESCSIVKLIQVGCRMFYSSKINKYILLKQTLLETETLKKRFAVVSLQQAKQLVIVIKVVRN